MKIFRYALIVVLWMTIILLAVIYGFLILAYLNLIVQLWHIGHPSPLLIIELIVLAVCLCVLVAHVCRRKRWYPKQLWHWGALVLLLALPLIVLAIDASPVIDDYSRADIAPPSKKAEESYDVFMTYRRGKEPDFKINAPHVLNLETITNALPYAEEIEKAWKDISVGRKYIEKLDSFEQIVDLIPRIKLDFETPMINFMSNRIFAYVYCAYVVLKAEEGKPEEGVRNLVQLHSVCRKALPNCVLLVPKMIWVAIARGNIETAYLIATKQNCTPETLEILKTGFDPLTHEDVSIRRPMIAEYLCVREFYLTVGKKPLPQSFLKKTALIFSPIFFNRNRTIRELKKRYDLIIAGASKCPPDIPNTIDELYNNTPRLRNPWGQMMYMAALPSFSKAAEMSSKIKVLSDLLAITLSSRSGQEINLPDFYTGKAYIIDEKTGAAMSAGPDGLLGTEDDIKLGDWPRPPSRGPRNK